MQPTKQPAEQKPRDQSARVTKGKFKATFNCTYTHNNDTYILYIYTSKHIHDGIIHIMNATTTKNYDKSCDYHTIVKDTFVFRGILCSNDEGRRNEVRESVLIQI